MACYGAVFWAQNGEGSWNSSSTGGGGGCNTGSRSRSSRIGGVAAAAYSLGDLKIEDPAA